MLVAADIAERDASNPPFRYLLKIQRPAAAAEDLNAISSGTDKPYRPLGDDKLILIDPRTDIDLIRFSDILQRGTWSWITALISRIDNQGSSAQGVGRNGLFTHDILLGRVCRGLTALTRKGDPLNTE